jgi:hypothetical protein
MSERTTCELCDRVLPKDASYVVRIDVFADPSMPKLSGEDLEEMDFDKAFAELIEQMKHLSADDLQDQVHRRFEYRLCPACQRRFLANPMGKPREARAGQN